MSWNGTVRCSWCGGRGHNRNGCEDRKGFVERNPDCYEADREKKRKGRSRQCSYCKGGGHNRATCPPLKDAKAKTVEYAAQWRAIAKPALLASGLGVGALLTEGTPRWDSVIYMVTGVEWESYDHRYKHEDYFRAYAVYATRVGHVGSANQARHTSAVNVRFCENDSPLVLPRNATYATMEVVSPISPEAVEAQIPTDWLGAKRVAELLFDKDTRPHNVDWVKRKSFEEK